MLNYNFKYKHMQLKTLALKSVKSTVKEFIFKPPAINFPLNVCSFVSCMALRIILHVKLWISLNILFRRCQCFANEILFLYRKCSARISPFFRNRWSHLTKLIINSTLVIAIIRFVVVVEWLQPVQRNTMKLDSTSDYQST